MDNTARVPAPRFQLRGQHIGLIVVVLALFVTAPRLTHTFIMSDGLKLSPTVEFWTLVTSAIAGAAVLTLGNAYLAHVLARYFARRDPLCWILAGAWVLYLLFATAIMAPALMVGLLKSDLAAVLPHGVLQWGWCIIAALCFEFLTAGSMAAYAIAGRHDTPQSETNNATLAPASDALAWAAPEPAPVRVVEVAPVMLECPDCGDPFGTKNALSAHKRFCKMRQAMQPVAVSANGNGVHA